MIKPIPYHIQPLVSSTILRFPLGRERVNKRFKKKKKKKKRSIEDLYNPDLDFFFFTKAASTFTSARSLTITAIFFPSVFSSAYFNSVVFPALQGEAKNIRRDDCCVIGGDYYPRKPISIVIG